MNSFSNPNDLQSAIEGNKREGRTSSFGPYGGMPLQNSPLPPSLGGGIPFSLMGTPPRPMHMNGNRPPLLPGESAFENGKGCLWNVESNVNTIITTLLDDPNQ